MNLFYLAACVLIVLSGPAKADDIGCISTTFNLLSPNDKVCVSDFDDPKVSGVTCHISQARKGGWGQPLGLNEDPSNFSVACRQTGPINVEFAGVVKSTWNLQICSALVLIRARTFGAVASIALADQGGAAA